RSKANHAASELGQDAHSRTEGTLAQMDRVGGGVPVPLGIHSSPRASSRSDARGRSGMAAKSNSYLRPRAAEPFKDRAGGTSPAGKMVGSGELRSAGPASGARRTRFVSGRSVAGRVRSRR